LRFALDNTGCHLAGHDRAPPPVAELGFRSEPSLATSSINCYAHQSCIYNRLALKESPLNNASNGDTAV